MVPLKFDSTFQICVSPWFLEQFSIYFIDIHVLFYVGTISTDFQEMPGSHLVKSFVIERVPRDFGSFDGCIVLDHLG